MPSIQDAEKLLEQYVESPSLRRHCRCVAASLAWYAAKLGEDVERWTVLGLLHDFDYEKFPEDHPRQGMEILRGLGYDETFIRAIGSHNDALGIPRETREEHYLFACDEISGFCVAVSRVKPNKSIHEVDVPSVMKRLKTPAFAAGVNRDDVTQGASEIGIDLEEHVGNILTALQSQAENLGIQGE
jgi:putative nucleotidyltransferase with HDIG domain